MRFILGFFYWFYGFEHDLWMRYYYSIFAFAALLTFYVGGLANYIGFLYDINFLIINVVGYTAAGLSIIVVCILFAFKYKSSLESKLIEISKYYTNNKNLTFYLCIIYVLLSFFVIIYSVGITRV